jgi:hypothetical protein
MQSPLETSVQALRNTRRVEEVCAWTTVGAQFPQMLSMSGVEAMPIVIDARCDSGAAKPHAIRLDGDRARAMNL